MIPNTISKANNNEGTILSLVKQRIQTWKPIPEVKATTLISKPQTNVLLPQFDSNGQACFHQTIK